MQLGGRCEDALACRSPAHEHSSAALSDVLLTFRPLVGRPHLPSHLSTTSLGARGHASVTFILRKTRSTPDCFCPGHRLPGVGSHATFLSPVPSRASGRCPIPYAVTR